MTGGVGGEQGSDEMPETDAGTDPSGKSMCGRISVSVSVQMVCRCAGK